MNQTNDRYTYYTDNKTIVVALSTYAGKPVKGIARCNPDDIFDLDYGKRLAATRCNLKIAKKRLKNAAKDLDHINEVINTCIHYRDNILEYYNNSMQHYILACNECTRVNIE